MKALLFTVATLFSITAMADQCAYISQGEAERAALLLQKGSVVAEYCELCGDTTATVSTVKSVSVAKVANGQYSEVSVNGKGVDLAYLYLQVAPGKKVNVAQAVNCETLDATTVSSVIK
jgi:hypothetical protein